jgi:hypothetical protein
MLLRRDIHGTADSDPALLVPVSPAADPLSGLTGVSGTLPSGDGQSQAENLLQHRPAHQTSSLAFFNTFTNDAKRASELNRKGYLDELLLHEDDPLYWINEAPSLADDFGDFKSGVEDRVIHSEIGTPHPTYTGVHRVSCRYIFRC